MKSARDIAEGYRKLNTKDKNVIRRSEVRMRHCKSCSLFTDAQSCNSKAYAPHVKTGELTSGCGCYMPSKTTLRKANCPLGKW